MKDKRIWCEIDLFSILEVTFILISSWLNCFTLILPANAYVQVVKTPVTSSFIFVSLFEFHGLWQEMKI